MTATSEDECTLSGTRPGEGAPLASNWWTCDAHGAWLGSAWKRDMSPSCSGPATHRRSHRGPVQCGLCGSQRWEPWWSDPRLLKPAVGTWNTTSTITHRHTRSNLNLFLKFSFSLLKNCKSLNYYPHLISDPLVPKHRSLHLNSVQLDLLNYKFVRAKLSLTVAQFYQPSQETVPTKAQF